MDNKNLKGLSEAYSEVYLDEATAAQKSFKASGGFAGAAQRTSDPNQRRFLNTLSQNSARNASITKPIAPTTAAQKSFKASGGFAGAAQRTSDPNQRRFLNTLSQRNSVVAAAGGKGGTVTAGRGYDATLGGKSGKVTYDLQGKRSFKANEEFEFWVDSLFDEGYDLSNYTWEGLFEVYCEEVLDEASYNPNTNTVKDLFDKGFGNTPMKGRVVSRTPTTGIAPAPNTRGPLWAMAGDKKPPASKANATSASRPAIPSASRPTAVPASRPTATSSTPIPRNSSSAKASIPERIKSGTQVYNAQRAGGDMKGAASTGSGVWAMANPTLAAKPKTSYNPLMNKTFGYQTGNSPKDISKANAIVSSGQVAALKPATPAPAPATPIAAAVKSTTPTPQRKTPSRAPITQMNSYDFGKPDHITQDVASLYQSIYEGKKKVDQDEDGDNDFADVQIAKMIASGMSKEEAIRKVRNKSYNEETELDEGRTEELKRKYTAKYGKLEYPTDTLRLNKTRRAYEKASRDNQYGYGPNPRTAIKGKQNLGQAMYKAGQSARVINAEFELWVNELLDEGYDLSDYTWDELGELYINEAKKPHPYKKMMKKSDELATSGNKKKMHRAAKIYLAANDPKLREEYDAYDLVLEYLLDEGYADDCDSANMMIERMSDEWLEEILESKN